MSCIFNQEDFCLLKKKPNPPKAVCDFCDDYTSDMHPCADFIANREWCMNGPKRIRRRTMCGLCEWPIENGRLELVEPIPIGIKKEKKE